MPGVMPLTEGMIKAKTKLDRLEDVKNLNLWGQGFTDVSILQHMPSVEVLSLSINKITGLQDFSHARNLQELYLRKNEIADLAEVQWLAPLTQLRVLWLTENPCAEHPLYRQAVAAVLPSLEKLDNQEITSQEREAAFSNPAVGAFLAQGPPPPEQQPSAGVAAASGQLPRAPSGSAAAPASVTRQASGGYRPAVEEPEPLPRQVQAERSERAAAASRAAPAPQPAAEPATKSSKNILYAVMALLNELHDDDLQFVKREVEMRLSRR